MTIATYTSSIAVGGAQANAPHTGVQSVDVKYVGSANTLSDIVLLAKIPDQARIVDFYGNLNSAEALNVIKIGVTGNETALGTHTLSASAQTTFDMRSEIISPFNVSLTDAVEPHTAFVFATPSAGSFTTTWTLELTVFYKADGKTS